MTEEKKDPSETEEIRSQDKPTEEPADAPLAEEAAEATETSEAQSEAPAAEEDPYEELNMRYLRLLADFDNFKRRTAREKEDIYKYANQGLLETLLPVLDAFEQALNSLPEKPDDALKRFGDGVVNIQRQLTDILAAVGMTRIEAIGQPFDPTYHEAIMLVEDDSVPSQTIVDELRAGYVFKDRVLRPTVCRVSQ